MDVLILIKARSEPTVLLEQPVYLATDFLVLPLSTTVQDVGSLSDPRDKHLAKLVQTGLATCHGRLWFSYERDLTNSIDRAHKKRESASGALWERVSLCAVRARSLTGAELACRLSRQAEDRFFWNRHMQSKLIDEAKSGRSNVSPSPGTCVWRG